MERGNSLLVLDFHLQCVTLGRCVFYHPRYNWFLCNQRGVLPISFNFLVSFKIHFLNKKLDLDYLSEIHSLSMLLENISSNIMSIYTHFASVLLKRTAKPCVLPWSMLLAAVWIYTLEFQFKQEIHYKSDTKWISSIMSSEL